MNLGDSIFQSDQHRICESYPLVKRRLRVNIQLNRDFFGGFCIAFLNSSRHGDAFGNFFSWEICIFDRVKDAKVLQEFLRSSTMDSITNALPLTNDYPCFYNLKIAY